MYENYRKNASQIEVEEENFLLVERHLGSDSVFVLVMRKYISYYLWVLFFKRSDNILPISKVCFKDQMKCYFVDWYWNMFSLNSAQRELCKMCQAMKKWKPLKLSLQANQVDKIASKKHKNG